MKKILSLLLFVLFPLILLAGDTVNPHTGILQKITDIQEEDGSPIIYAPETIKVTNGTLTDNLDGTVSLFIGAGGITPWDDIGDPDANTTINLAGYTSILTSTLDNGTVLKIDNSDADLANDTTLLELEFTDDADDNGIFLKCNDNNGDLMFKIGINGRMTIGPGATDYILPTARGAANSVLMDNGAGAVTFTVLADGNITDALTINNATSVTTAALTVNGQADIEGYSSIGNGSALDSSYTMIIDRDFTDIGNGNVAQLIIGGDITKTTFAPGTNQSFLQVGTNNIDGPSSAMSFDGVSPPLATTLTLYEPNIIEASGASVVGAYTLYIADAPTEGDENASLKVDAGNVIFDGGLSVGGVVDFSGATSVALPSGEGGRSLTVNGTAINADAELYTDTKCLYWENPVATDDFKSIWIADGYAVTITRIYAESDQTVTLNLQRDDGTPTDIATADLAPAAGTATACASGCTTTLIDAEDNVASGQRIDLDVASVANTPTWCSVCFTFTRDD